MDFLFDNPLANMQGPAFLAIYGSIIVFAAFIFYFFKSSFDWTDKQPIPLIPKNPDPFEISFIRGGQNEFARSIIFSLTQKGFLKISAEGKKNSISYAENQPNWTTLSEVERAALSWFQTPREISEIFSSFGLTETLSPFWMPFEQKMNQENLLTPEEVKSKTRSFSLLFFGIIALLGSYKFLAAIQHGRSNYMFLFIFTLVAFIIFWYLGMVKRLSKKGTTYVEKLQEVFSQLKENQGIVSQQISQPLATFNSVDPILLAMGIFGTSILAGTGYGDFQQAFHRANASISGGSCGSSCGSSCSSGSDGGSSCGGSSCGGGCGGCGGGD